MSDEANIVGKGHEILLPPQGNPFDRNKGGEPMAKTKAAPADEPRDLSPADIAARFAGPDPAPMGVVGDEIMDLTPEDIAARFPTHHDDRNRIPGVADDEPVLPPVSPQPPVIASAPPRRIGKMDEGMVEPPVPAVEPVATAESATPSAAIDDDRPIISTESPMPDTVAVEPSAALDDSPITSTEVPLPDAVAAMPLMAEPTPLVQPEVAPMAPPERMTMADITPTSPNDADVLPPAPTPETVAPPTPVVGFKPLNPFATTPARQYSIAQPVSASPDDISDSESLGLDEGVSTQGAAGAYALPPVVEDESMVSRLITDERVDQLWQRIDAAEKQAVSDDSSLPHQRTANLENLKAARNLLLGGRKNYEDAQRYVVEVEADVLYANRVRHWSYSFGLLVLLYDLIWLGLLAWGALSGRAVSERFAIDATQLTPQFTLTIWVTVLSGGLGGVTKSFFSLATHVSKQDFDRQHMMWYLTSPLMGAVMGVFVVMAAQIGIFTLSGGNTAGGNAVYILYVLSCLAGFQQNIALKLVERAIEVVFKPEEEKKPVASPPAPEAEK